MRKRQQIAVRPFGGVLQGADTRAQKRVACALGDAQVLVAEDEALLRIIAVEMLEEAGFSVLQAADGVEALSLLKDNPDVRLLVSDVKMPRMDGYALVQESRKLNPDIKIILMTGYANEPPPEVLAHGPIDTLYKPFDVEHLCELAAKTLAAA